MLTSRELLSEICNELRNQGKRIVFTNGCFDILHSGHVIYLAEAKKLGDVMIVGLNSDASVKRLKGESRPINSELDRQIILSGLKSVDYVSIFDEDTPLELILACKPDLLVKGGDYSEDNIVGADFVKSRGGKVVTIPLVPGKSTTNIVSKMKD